MFSSSDAVVNEVKGWTPPTFHQKSECYVSFTAYCPETRKMKLKKIMLGRVKGKRQQRMYAEQIMKRLTEKLMNGWNPWVEQNHPKEYELFNAVCDKYRDYLYKMIKDDGMRPDTVASYISYLKIMQEWNETRKITYIYQFDRKFVADFLDYVFVVRNNTLQTRNNYLAWVKTFAKYLLSRAYISTDPTEGFHAVQRRVKKKNRDVIPADDLKRIYTLLYNSNRHYLLACYLLHYVFVRPHEMSFIKVEDISVRKQTLLIHGENAKNRNDATVTLPKKVLKLMLDLGIFNAPGNYYLFSDGFMPGRERRSEKVYRDYWVAHVRKPLNLSARYKFYSLKDTGITNMLRANTDIVSVRDQARHSSILITDTYTPKDIRKANPLLLSYEGEF